MRPGSNYCLHLTKERMPPKLYRSPPRKRRKSKRGVVHPKRRRPVSPRRGSSSLFSPRPRPSPPPQRTGGFFSRFFAVDAAPRAPAPKPPPKAKVRPAYPKLDASKDEPGEPACVVCMDNKAAVLFEPCKHLKVCRGCTLGLAAGDDAKMFQCPICRVDVAGFSEVFM